MKQNETKIAYTGKKQKVAEMLASPEFTGTTSELLRQADVPRTTFYRWMDDRDYVEYINSLIEKYSDGELAGVWKALIKECKGGNVQAIKLYFELKGKYRQQVDLSGGVVFLSGEDSIAD